MPEKTTQNQWRDVLSKINKSPLSSNLSRFQKPDWLPPKLKQVDRLTGLPILNSETRNILVGELSQCIKNNAKWACLYMDADQLKTANDRHGRSFGDAYINWETTTTIDTLEKASLTDKTTVRMVRPSHAADEVIIWFFNLTDEDMQKIHKIQESVGTPVSIPELSFTFSLSAGLLTSDDYAIKDSLNNTQKYLLSDPKTQPFELFQVIEEKTEELAKVEKIAKDLHRLPLAELMQQKNISALITVMKNNLGGSRISEHLLELILKLQSIQTIRLLGNHIDNKIYREMLTGLGVKAEDLNNVESPNKLISLFRNLFGEIDEE
ncbi:MAG: diguanylate cyclase [Patescibacteria group bacterium]